MKDEEWALCASELGLRALETPAIFANEAHVSFPARLRERLTPVTGAVTCAHVLAGVWRGHRCLLEHRARGRQHHELHVAVEIAPPLGLALYVGPKGTRGLVARGAAATHDPEIDGRFDLEAADEGTLAAMLRPRDDDDRRLLQALASEGAVVTDSTVVAWGDAQAREQVGLVDVLRDPFGTLAVRGQSPKEVAGRLDRLVWIAREVAARRARVPMSPAERARGEAWRAAGAKHGLAFDPRRGTLGGELGGASIAVGIESRLRAMHVEGSHPAFYTSFMATFAQPLGLGLYVDAAGFFNWLGELVGRDIVVGHAAFDRAFRVRGAPEDAVKATLAPAAEALAAVAAAGFSVTVTDDAASLLRPERAESEQDLDRALALAMPALRALSPR